jgi:hypothetical protein
LSSSLFGVLVFLLSFLGIFWVELIIGFSSFLFVFTGFEIVVVTVFVEVLFSVSLVVEEVLGGVTVEAVTLSVKDLSVFSGFKGFLSVAILVLFEFSFVREGLSSLVCTGVFFSGDEMMNIYVIL